MSKLKRVTRDLTRQLGRNPTIHEVARKAGTDAAEVAFLKDLERHVISLDVPVSGDPDSVTLLDVLPDLTDDFEEILERERRDAVKRALNALSDRERHVIVRRRGLDGGTPRTLEEIGAEYGLTRERIRQIESQAMKKLGALFEMSSLRDTL
jgi:RNA polymerase nonessential primary-like sigma factor